MRTLQFPKLKPWQKDVYDTMENSRGTGKVFVVKAKRQVGKSILAAIEVIKFSIEQPCTSIILEPTLLQSRRVFKDICEWMSDSGIIKDVNNSLLEINFTNGSEIVFKSAEQRDRLRGYTVTGLLVIDEAAFITDDILEIVFPWTDAHSAPILMISTPLFCDGQFYKLFSTADEVTSFAFDWSQYDTSEFLSESKLNYYKANFSELKFKSEYLGEFITDGSYVFNNITGVFNTVNLDEYESEVYVGIDWGTGQRSDYTAVVSCSRSKKDHDNVLIRDLIIFNDKSPTDQIKFIADYLNQNKNIVKVTVEKNSIGNVYADYLKQSLHKKNMLTTFVTTNESKRKIIESLQSYFSKGLIKSLPLNQNIKTEFLKETQHYILERTKNGSVTYNAMSGFHDDIIMALSICLNSLSNPNKYSIKII